MPAPPHRSSPSGGDTTLLALRVWREWVWPERRTLGLAALLMAAVAVATGAYPLLIERAFALFEGGDTTLAAALPLAVVAVAAAKGAALYAQGVVTTGIVERVVTAVRLRLFTHLLHADAATLAALPAGGLAARFVADVDPIRIALSRVLTGLVRDVLTVAALVAAMFYLDWALSLVFFAVYPLAAVPIVRIGRHVRRIARAAQAQIGDMAALLTESLAGARLVRAFGLEAYEERRAAAAFGENRRIALDALAKRARLEPTLEVLAGLAVAAVIAFAGWRIAGGEGTVGTFTGFVGALLIAAQPIRAIGTLNTAVQEGLAAAQRVFDLLDRRPAIRDRADARPLAVTRGEIRFEGVRFRYGPGPEAVAGFDAVIAPGSTVALVGRSGSGKSTLFNLLTRLYDADAGAIRIDGQDIRGVTLASLRGAFALVAQDSILFDDTVRANIAFGRADAADDAVVAAARAAAAHDFVAMLPRGYDTPVGDRGSALSGGQRQRIALARAFLRDAPILLLDEPTSALDAESEGAVQEALDRLRRGRTTLVIAHRLATVRRADRILVMDAGRIVEDGMHAALSAADGLYARLCRLQFADAAPAG